ncbi:MAG: galactose oxidase early set domain-containing protein [Nostoc sp.]|uniref:galactose oxidase early set domain-containing protein n=1 Tax=Nostoc sp. TaxID=1180 RepID=UPI002FF87011
MVSVFLAFILAVAITIYGWEQAIAQPIVGSKEEMGAWETIPMPPKDNLMQSVHTLLLPNGKVLSVNGSSFRNTVVINNEKHNPTFIEGVNVTDYDVINNTALLDPETGKFERIASPPVQQYGEINDLFCSGHLQLADGNVLFVGGTGRYYPGGAFTGSRQVNLYDWKTGKWSAAGQLKEGRWYPSLISLADGKIVIFSGLKYESPNQVNPSLEIYDPKTKKLHYIDLTTVKNSPFNTKLTDVNAYDTIDLYPRVLPTADGKLLITGDDAGIGGVLVTQSSKKSYLMSVQEGTDGQLSVSFEVVADRGEPSKAYGTAVQVPNSEDVLLLGGIIGTNDINYGRGGNTAGFANWSRVSTSLQHWTSPSKSGEKNGKWEIVNNFLDKPRANLQAVILPNQEVLVVNGGEYPEYKPVYEPLLMTPDSRAIGGYITKSMNPAKLPRLYHNGAILLPDARVLIIGGNANRTAREKDGTLHVNIQREPQIYYYTFPKLIDKSGNSKEFNLEEYYQSPQSYFIEGDKEPFVPSEIWQAEIFSPPYLFKPGTRPEIVKAPETLNYGKSNSISVKDATEKGSVVLIKLGAVTHSLDYGQRLADLEVENVAIGDESAIKFKAPKNANLYPPGYYMIFYLNELGKPSHAKMVKLEV